MFAQKRNCRTETLFFGSMYKIRISDHGKEKKKYYISGIGRLERVE